MADETWYAQLRTGLVCSNGDPWLTLTCFTAMSNLVA